MARTIPAAWSTAAAAVFGKPYLLFRVQGISYFIKATSGPDATISAIDYTGQIVGIDGGIGPECHWRGGLGTRGDYGMRLIAQIERYILSASTMPDYNTIDPWFRVWDSQEFYSTRGFVAPISRAYHPTGPTAQEGVTYIIFDDGSMTIAEALQIDIGPLYNISFADPNLLEIAVMPYSRRLFDLPLTALLGNEKSGKENYDAARPIADAGLNKVVPILYGHVPSARTLTIHDAATSDDAVRSGLFICVTDSRFRRLTVATEAITKLYVFDEQRDSLDEILALSIDASNTGQWEEYDPVTDPENLGGSGGVFARWLDNQISGSNWNAGNEARMMARGGKLLIKRAGISATAVIEPAGLLAKTQIVDDDSATSYADTATTTGNSADSVRMVTVVFEGLSRFAGEVYRIFLKTKYTHSGALPASWFVRAASIAGASVLTVYDWDVATDLDDEVTVDGKAVTLWEETQTAFNNYDGADTDRIGWREHYDAAPNSLFNVSDLGNYKVTLELRTNGVGSPPANTQWFGIWVDLWHMDEWVNYLDGGIFANAYGIADEAVATYTATGDSLVEIPSDVFDHLVRAVLGGTTSGVSTARTAMTTDALKLDFQIVDADETAETILDRIAWQSASHIFPADDGTLKIVYRPGVAISATDAHAPITNNDINKGSFRSTLTPIEDVRAGVIVNYEFDHARDKFNKQARLLYGGHHLKSTITSAGYQELANFLVDITKNVLELDADLICDQTTAERLCKWEFLQHHRQRQMVEFDLPLQFAKLEPGDLLAIQHHGLFSYGRGKITINHTTRVCTKGAFGTAWKPTGDTANIILEHPDDLLIIDGATPNAGVWRITSVTDKDTFTLDSGHTLTNQGGVPEDCRIVPPFEVMSAKIVWRSEAPGPVVHVVAVERIKYQPGQAAL